MPKSHVMQMLRGKHYLDSLKIVSIRGISAAKDLDITRTVDTLTKQGSDLSCMFRCLTFCMFPLSNILHVSVVPGNGIFHTSFYLVICMFSLCLNLCLFTFA